MRCRLSLKTHFIHLRRDFFPENLGAVSDEQGKRFYHIIRTMGTGYQGRRDPAMMGEYCYTCYSFFAIIFEFSTAKLIRNRWFHWCYTNKVFCRPMTILISLWGFHSKKNLLILFLRSIAGYKKLDMKRNNLIREELKVEEVKGCLLYTSRCV